MTLTVSVAIPKDYVAAMVAISNRQSWINSKTFGKFESNIMYRALV